MNQRRTLLLATGVAAGLGGLAVAWWQQTPPASPTAATPTPAPAQVFWHSQFKALDGSLINVSQFKGRPLLVNFWATWCPPCVAELPLIDSFYQQNKSNGWQVLGLAVDNPAPVESFLRARPVSFMMAIMGAEGVAFSKSLGNIGGGLPFTLVFNAQGEIAHVRLGAVSAADLDLWRAIK